MADYPRRPDPEKPRVDDLFYDNPDPDTVVEPSTDADIAGDGASRADAPDTGSSEAGSSAGRGAETDGPETHTSRADDLEASGTGDDNLGVAATPADVPDEDREDASGEVDEVHEEGPDDASDDVAEGGPDDRPDDASDDVAEGGPDDRPDDTPGNPSPDASDSLPDEPVDDDDRAGIGPSAANAAGRRRRAAAGRWARAVALVGAAAVLVYGAGAEQLGGVDLAAALDRSASSTVPGSGPSGPTVVTDSSIGCLGPDLVGLDDPTVAEPDQSVSVSVTTAPAEALGEGIDTSGSGAIALAATPDGATERSSTRAETVGLQLSGATWARGTATGSLAPGFAGSQLGVDLAEQQRGLSMAGCGPAVDEAWFVAGGAEPGRAERLILANPTGNPVTADVEVLGADGPVDVVGGRGIVVPPAGRQVVLVDALAPGEERPVIHLTTTGGPVLAAVGDRWLEGTLDRGTELTTATAEPAKALVIPAVSGPTADSADTSTVRVGVPGAEQAVVQLRALTADGPVRVTNAVTTVDAGAVADIDVSDLPEGTQAIEVVADTPVVAAAQVVRRAEPEGVSELAWVPAVRPSAGLVGLPVRSPDSGQAAWELTVASVEGASVEVVTVTPEVTHVQPVEIPPAGSRALELSAATRSVWVRTVEGTAASAVLTTLQDDHGTLIAGTVPPEAPVTRQVRSVAPWMP